MILLAACWGLAGAAAVEALDLYRAIKRTKGYPWRQPDEVPLGPYVLSVAIRLGLGVLAAVACAASGQIEGPAGGFAAGFAAPKLFEQLARLRSTEPDSPAVGNAEDESVAKRHLGSYPKPRLGAEDAPAAPPDGGTR